MENFTPVSATIGGLLIGLASVALMLGNGRIAGISGILGGLFQGAGGDRRWRLAFIAGLLIAPWLYTAVSGAKPDIVFPTSTPLLILGGLCVGFGTQMGSGCTSGHGVCGISRFSLRSTVATVTFMLTGMLTVFFLRHVFA